MSTARTELEWLYEPSDFFETPRSFRLACGDLSLEGGAARLSLQLSEDPLSEGKRALAESRVIAIFDAHRLLTHANYSLKSRGHTQVDDTGKRHIVVYAKGFRTTVFGKPALGVVRNADGEIILDPVGDKARAQQKFVDDLALKASKSPVLAMIVRSYGEAVADPDNELVHLYEIRDALATFYGKEDVARSTLGISKAEWKELGRLANATPIEQGRHRGQHLQNLRPASETELTTAREAAKRLISLFAATIT